MIGTRAVFFALGLCIGLWLMAIAVIFVEVVDAAEPQLTTCQQTPPTDLCEPDREGAVGTAMIGGDANFANPSHGSNYLAMRLPRGTIVTICGAGGCWRNARVNDYGPAEATGDIADIAFVKFMKVCGYSREQARQMGECTVTVEIGAIPLPPTDTVKEDRHDLRHALAIRGIVHVPS